MRSGVDWKYFVKLLPVTAVLRAKGVVKSKMTKVRHRVNGSASYTIEFRIMRGNAERFAKS